MTVKTLLKILLCIVLAAVSSFCSVSLALRRPFEAVANGPWKTNPTTGSSSAGLYHRARVAKYGLWALSSSEVVYFSATEDSSGERLDRKCSYLLKGSDMPTRWWSVAAYLDDHFIPNRGNRYSYSQSTVEREGDGKWIIRLAPDSQSRNWLPSGDKDGTLVLTLRFYNPEQKAIDNPASIQLPKIIREGCK